MQVSTNTFSEGLVMDFAPEVTKNNCLTNALNATLVTMNGNELQLQNDMGNGKVYKAELPEGYVPLGTTELGGIIYIVSYNPFTNKCQIGSFPSPQRVTYSTTKYQEDYKVSTFDIDKYILSEQSLNPGDKFYFTVSSDIVPYIYPGNDNSVYRFIKVKAALLSNDNKLVYLNIPPNKLLYQQKEKTEIENNSSWNILNTKISGKPILIFEKVLYNYSVAINGYFTSQNKLCLSLNNMFNCQDRFFPYGLYINLSLLKIVEDPEYNAPSTEYIYRFTNTNDSTIAQATSNQYNIIISDLLDINTYTQDNYLLKDGCEFDNEGITAINNTIANISIEDRNKYVLSIYITPLSYNNTKLYPHPKLPYYYYHRQEYYTELDLSLLGTGTIKLSQYKYKLEVLGNLTDTNQKVNVTINYAFITALREQETIQKVTIELIDQNNNITTLNENTQISGETKATNLYLNYMYVVKFTIQTSMEETTIYRWLLTNVLYNSIYEDNQYTDFSNVTLDIPINVNQTMLETTLVSNGTENSPFNKIGKNLATQTVTQTTKYTASVKEQVNFEQENNIPFNLLSCNIIDINGQDVKTTLGINNCTIQQYLNGQVQYEVNIASEAYTGTTDALLPTRMSNDYSGYITLGFDPVNGWTDSNNTNYQNLTDYSYKNQEGYLPPKQLQFKFNTDEIDFEIEVPQFKSDSFYVALPTMYDGSDDGKLFITNILKNNSNSNIVSNVFKRILQTLYYYKENYVLKDLGYNKVTSYNTPDNKVVNINLDYSVSGNFELLVNNNKKLDYIVNYFRKQYDLPQFKYTFKLKQDTLSINKNITDEVTNFKSIDLTIPGGIALISPDQSYITILTEGSYTTDTIYYWDNDNVYLVNQYKMVRLYGNDNLCVNPNVFKIKNGILGISSGEQTYISYRQAESDEEYKTTIYYGNKNPLCSYS